MIIRSQDKKGIINFNQITNISVMFSSRMKKWEVCACFPYELDSDCGYSIIATYSTEEKAIKVLDMIQSNYERRWEVFQMPQDSEVEV